MATAPMNPAYLLDPSLYGDQQAIDQQRQIAQLLMTQGITPMGGTESVGGVAIRRSPMEGAAKLAQLLSGQSIQRDANTASQSLMSRQGALMANLLGGVGTPTPQGASMGTALGGEVSPGGVPQGGGVGGAPPQSMIPRLPGDNTGMLSLMALQDPEKYAGLIATANAPTDLHKQLLAQGIVPGDPRYAQAFADAQSKSNYIPSEEVKAGNTAIDPRTKKPIAFGVKVPEGGQPTFGPDNRMTSVSMVPGVTDAMTAGKAAETANDIIDVPTENNKIRKMTRAQFLSWIGAGPGKYDFSGVKPGTEDAFRAAIKNSGDLDALVAFDKRGQPPGVITGQSTSEREGDIIGTKDVIGRNQSILADANAAPLDIESLNKMLKLTDSAQFGPGASNVAKWKAMAAQFPGMNLIVNPNTLEEQQANVTEMKKYMSNMAGRMSGSSGTGTDARLQNAIDSLPNDAAPNEAIKRVAPMLIAQRTARLDEARLRSSLGNDAAAIQAFETKWRDAYNPLAYEATLATRGMTAQQAAAFVAKTYTPAQAAEIAKARAALRGLGVQF